MKREAIFTPLSPNRVQVDTVDDAGEHIAAQINTRGCEPMDEKAKAAMVELVVRAHKYAKERNAAPLPPEGRARE